mgnify:CR=1 FL=1
MFDMLGMMGKVKEMQTKMQEAQDQLTHVEASGEAGAGMVKATANGNTDGFIKVIFDAKYGEWLGCHMIGANVTEMIAEAVVARNLETTGMEIVKSVHPHPTMSEAIMEAAAQAYGEVIHL